MSNALIQWRSAPPAVFGALLGLNGLGLAWRRAHDVWAVPAWIGEGVLAIGGAAYALALALYLAKVLARRDAMMEDLQGLPGRMGLAAASLSAMLLAAGLAPYSVTWSGVLLATALFVHMALLIIFVRLLWQKPRQQRQAVPPWHLTFVGFIVAPPAAMALGQEWLAEGILGATIGVGAAVYLCNFSNLRRFPLPQPQRPLLCIHLAPLSLYGTAAVLLGHGSLAWIMFALASVVLLLLLICARGLLQTGPSPLWSAFTFPLAAYSGLALLLVPAGQVPSAIAIFALGLASFAVLGIVPWVLWLWVRGRLAGMTGASTA